MKTDLKSFILGWCAAMAILCASGLVWWMLQTNHAVAASTGQAHVMSPEPQKVVVKVDGEAVFQNEIEDLIQTGIDRAIVVDRMINKVIAAQKGKLAYPAETQLALKLAEREVLSTIYTTKRLQELRENVSEQDIAHYYSAQIKDENFKLWKVSYYLSQDPQDIQLTAEKLRNADPKALAQMLALTTENEGYLPAQALPYGLARVVNDMKKGEFSPVLNVRNGLMLVRLDDMRQGQKPSMEALRDQIREAIVLERFNRELEQARQEAKIELS